MKTKSGQIFLPKESLSYQLQVWKAVKMESEDEQEPGNNEEYTSATELEMIKIEGKAIRCGDIKKAA